MKIRIDKYEYISFDLYDTLIFRIVAHPADIFKYVEIAYKKKYGEESSIHGFASSRKRAEEFLRQHSDREVRLDDIYNKFLHISESKIIERYKNLEIEIEFAFSMVNREMIAFYNFCIEQRKKIIITSDMYLPKEIMKALLEKKGINGYDKIYVSSENGDRKANGTLYNYIVNDLGIAPNKILHIGDNFKSDFVKAKEKGLRAFLYRSNVATGITYPLDRFLTISGGRNNKEYNLGYNCLGPMLYGFVDWLYNEVESDGCEKIFFFSRDGYVMQKAYSLLTGKKATYFYTSRRALQVAAIWIDPRYEIVMKSMFLKRQNTITSIIKKWGLEPEECEKVVARHGFSRSDEVAKEFIEKNERLHALFEELKEKIINNSKEECRCLKRYLIEQGFHGRVTIVDIGWYGNMQNALEKIVKALGIDVEIKGYYLGIVPTASNQNRYFMKGYLFAKNKNEGLYSKERYFGSLFEMLFMAPHGSIKKYADKGIEMYDFTAKEADTFLISSSIQEAALEFVSNFSECGKFIYNDEIKFSERIVCFFTMPSLQNATYFGNLYIVDEIAEQVAVSKGIFRYLISPQQFVLDFLNSKWKIGFLKRTFLIPVNYYKIIKLTRCLIGKDNRNC